VAVIATVVVLGAAAGLAVAQQPAPAVTLPTVTVNATPSAVSVGAPGPLAAGPTTIAPLKMPGPTPAGRAPPSAASTSSGPKEARNRRAQTHPRARTHDVRPIPRESSRSDRPA